LTDIRFAARPTLHEYDAAVLRQRRWKGSEDDRQRAAKRLFITVSYNHTSELNVWELPENGVNSTECV
jgi:hypothetical protein